jgi:error-prone DNA polymerase
MGFYATAQIVRDAKLHGVEVRPVCVNHSVWDCTLEPPDPANHDERPDIVMAGEGPQSTTLPRRPALRSVDGGPPPTMTASGKCATALKAVRLGLRMTKGLSITNDDELIARRGAGYRSIEDLWHRVHVPIAALERLAEADAFQALGLDRRTALWTIRGLSDTRLPLFDRVPAEPDPEPAVTLAAMTAGRQVVEDYRSTGLSLRRHPISFLRRDLAARRIVRCADLVTIRDGKRLEVAGIILVRQRPGSARGVLFMTIEDETGHANLILWPSVFEAQRRLVLSASMLACRGKLQREGEVIHVIAEHLTDLSGLLRGVGERDKEFPVPHGRGDDARRDSAPDPREAKIVGSRDIHVHDLRLGHGIPRPGGIKVPTRDFR